MAITLADALTDSAIATLPGSLPLIAAAVGAFCARTGVAEKATASNPAKIEIRMLQSPWFVWIRKPTGVVPTAGRRLNARERSAM
jgi:hypothetical protein